ncbi:hypothetical protein BDM02DRAFT_3257798 [Thelephora ganbajun]|uniref:Uncharacterized protein n=1 Tax=Thelephora ganbajun TaxID=370292 RepID=A0ACB6ZWT4_THEGA|nr:hypothetical protein BDM02DRAFT_3257798 [Thelephora ganbajun]
MTTVTINDLAQELLDAVIDEVGNFTNVKSTPNKRRLGTQTLKSCSLVARAWSSRARQHIFHEVEFTSLDLFSRWQTAITCGETSPYGFVQTLHFREKTDQWITADSFSKILPHLVNFPRVENLIFTQYDITPLVLPLQQASVPFLESVRYLEVDSVVMNTPQELFALIDCFPHLEDLNLGHGRVRRHYERGVYPEKAVERFRGRLYITTREREDDVFLKELAARPVRFQEVRVVESPFRQPLCDLVAACAPTLKRLQVLAPSRDSGLSFDGNQNSLLEPLPTDRPLVDLSSCVKLQRLRLSTRNLNILDDWIMPMLHTITKVPEELTLHEAPMFQSYGIEFVRGDVWGEIDACLTALAIKAVEQGQELKFVLTTGLFSTSQCEPSLRSRLSSFAEKGTFTVSRSPPTYSYAKGPF